MNTIKFKNGSIIKTIDSSDAVRSKIHYYPLFDTSRLYWWQRLYLKLYDFKIVIWFYKFKRR
jgi:hypothetical protein